MTTPITLAGGLIAVAPLPPPALAVAPPTITPTPVTPYAGEMAGYEPATAVVLTATADMALSGHRAVRWATRTTVAYATAADPANPSVIGITLAAAAAGTDVAIATSGRITEPSWTWTPNQLVFLGADGHLTQQIPTAPALTHRLVLGRAITPDTVWIAIQPPTRLTQE